MSRFENIIPLSAALSAPSELSETLGDYWATKHNDMIRALGKGKISQHELDEFEAYMGKLLGASGVKGYFGHADLQPEDDMGYRDIDAIIIPIGT